VMVRGARAVFEEMTADDLFDIVWRVFAPRVDRGFKNGHRESLKLDEIRKGEGLSEDALAHRAYLKLPLNYYRSRKEPPTNKDEVRIEGALEDRPKQLFARVLTAIQRQQEMTPIESVSVAWDEVMGIRRWFLGESGLATKSPIVEITPLETECLLY